MSGTSQEEIVSQMVDQAGQPDESPEVLETEQASNDKPEYVSKADFDTFVAGMERKFQSQLDKASSRTEKKLQDAFSKIEEIITTNRALGMEISDEQADVMREKALKLALKQIGTPDPTPPAQEQVQVDPVTATANMLLQADNVVLEKDDPLWKMVKTNAATPSEYIQSVMKLIEAYKERDSKPKSSAAAPSAVGKGNSGSSDNVTVLTNQLMELVKHPTPQNLPKIQELKAKLQKLEG